jgi:hypothetical protein
MGEGTASGARGPKKEGTVRRTVRILSILALVVAVASVSVWAQSSPHFPRVPKGETYLKADIWKNVSGPITQMPIVEEGGPSPASASISVEGTKAFKGDNIGGSAIPGATFGTAFLTPSEKTGKEIRRVIARLG